jgi:hypothetical protein
MTANRTNRWMTPRERECVERREDIREQQVRMFGSLNLRVDLTLKQRRNSDLHTVRPQDEDLTVRIRSRRVSLQDAALSTPFYYLSDDEVRRIVVRVMNRLNREMFGARARHKTNPKRMTALVCQHDKDSRRHLHCLLELPAEVSRQEFTTKLDRILTSEPFVHREKRIETVDNLTASMVYNMNTRKSLGQASVDTQNRPLIDTSKPAIS